MSDQKINSKNLCVLCKDASYIREYNRKKPFFVCGNCGAIFLDPQEIPSDPSSYYSEDYYPLGFKGHGDTERFLYRLDDIWAYVKRGSHILETGAASGEFLKLLTKHGYHVQGVELSKRAAEYGKEKYEIDIHTGDLFSAYYPDSSFDAVVMYHVLEHLLDPQAVIQEVYRILKPDGTLIIEVPHPTGIDAFFSKKLRDSIFDVPNHTVLFTPRVLSSLLLQEGFEVSKCYPSFSFLISNLIRGILRSKKGSSCATTKASSTSNIKRPSSPGKTRRLIKRALSYLLPGMKLTCIGSKPLQP